MPIYIYIYKISKINFLKKYKAYSSHPQKHIPGKYLKNLSMKTIFLGNDFIRALLFYSKWVPREHWRPEEINLR